MSIAKMKRLRLIALNDQKEDLLAGLLHVGCVEVSEAEDKLADPEWAALVKKDEASVLDVRARINALGSAMEALKKYGGVKSALFEIRSEISEEALFDEALYQKEMESADKINDLVRDIAQNYSKENRLSGIRASLVPWKAADWPMDQESTAATDITFGTCPVKNLMEDLTAAVEAAAPEAAIARIHEDRELKYLMIITHKSVTEAVLEALRPFAFSHAHFKDMPGTAAEEIQKLDISLAALKEERAKLEQEIASYKDEYGVMKICMDRLTADVDKEYTHEKFLKGDSVFYAEGWFPENRMEKLTKELEKFTCAYEYADPQEGDTVPVLCENSKLVTPMHMVTEMYSLPAYDGVDPNPLIFPFFVFYFGFMFADMGYGLIILLVSLFITKKFKPKGTMGYMFNLGILLGISTTICGFFIGSFFGDAVTVISETFMGQTRELWALINPLKDPMTVLYFGIILGIIQMVFGQCIKIWMGFRDGNGLDAVLDVVPWWILFIGIGLTVAFGSPIPVIIGALALICTQGRHNPTIPGKIFGGVASLYDITSWLGDVLSYARLMALMLATTVIANVVNILATLPGSIIAFIVIFVVGHIFNLGINLIGTYVHAARLQYLEFFGKFYKDGGVPFKPLAYNTKYVDVVEDENA